MGAKTGINPRRPMGLNRGQITQERGVAGADHRKYRAALPDSDSRRAPRLSSTRHRKGTRALCRPAGPEL